MATVSPVADALIRPQVPEGAEKWQYLVVPLQEAKDSRRPTIRGHPTSSTTSVGRVGKPSACRSSTATSWPGQSCCSSDRSTDLNALGRDRGEPTDPAIPSTPSREPREQRRGWLAARRRVLPRDAGPRRASSRTAERRIPLLVPQRRPRDGDARVGGHPTGGSRQGRRRRDPGYPAGGSPSDLQAASSPTRGAGTTPASRLVAVDSRSSSGALSCSTSLPCSSSNRPEHASTRP